MIVSEGYLSRKGRDHETQDPERHLMFWTLALIVSLWALCELGAMWAGRR